MTLSIPQPLAAAPTTHARIDLLLPPLDNARLLLVDDDAGMIQVMGKVLSGYTQLRFATHGQQALEIARSWLPELILLDAEMPGLDGFEVCRQLKADSVLADIPVMFVTQHNAATVEAAVFELGAVDFLVKPFVGPALRARVAMHLRLQRMAQHLMRLSHRDPLTGVADRHQFDDELLREWRRAARLAQPMALLLAGIDGFADLNVQQGRAAADHRLRDLAGEIQQLLQRPADLLARYGADEFALLLPDTAMAGAIQIAERLQQQLRGFTASIGIGWALPGEASDTASALATQQEPCEPLRAAARMALDVARQHGGGQIFVCQSEPTGPGLAAPVSAAVGAHQ